MKGACVLLLLACSLALASGARPVSLAHAKNVGLAKLARFGPPDPKLLSLAKNYIQFGSHPDYPHDANCTQWAHLFRSDGVRNTPGMPPSSGWDQLTKICLVVRSQFETLLDISHAIIPVLSWNNEMRVAIAWDLLGTKPDGSVVQANVISALFTDQNYGIETSWDFLPPLMSQIGDNKIEPINKVKAVNDVNLTEIARLYSTFGSPPGDIHTYDCNKWAALFTPDGIRNTPGQPPAQGTAKLVEVCNIVRSQFSELFPYSTEIIPVTSWNNEKRVAFQWTIAGVEAKTEKQVDVAAITTLFTDQNGLIETAWDFLDPSQLM